MSVIYFIGMLTVIHSSQGNQLIPNCNEKLSGAKICTSVNSSVDLNISPSDFHVEVTTLIRLFNFVDLDWTENTITIFLQIMSRWKDPRFKVVNDQILIFIPIT